MPQEDQLGCPDVIENISGSLPPDLSKSLLHLRKTDPRTRQKALLSIVHHVRQNPGDALLFLDPWKSIFCRLMLDPSQLVRAASCEVMNSVSTAVGRKIAPVLKSVFPALYLAQFDESEEVSQTAKATLSKIFPDNRLKKATEFYIDQVGCINPSVLT